MTFRLSGQTLQQNDPQAIELRDRFLPGKEIHCVPVMPQGEAGQCYKNVKQAIAQHGGAAITGWSYCLVPGAYAELLHHAVWKKPNGQMVDVTKPAYFNMSPEFISFTLDFNDPVDHTVFDPAVPSKFIPKSNDRDVLDYIDLTIKRTKTMREYKKKIRELIYYLPSPQGMQQYIRNPEKNTPLLAEMKRNNNGTMMIIDAKRETLVERLLIKLANNRS